MSAPVRRVGVLVPMQIELDPVVRRGPARRAGERPPARLTRSRPAAEDAAP